jgi:hypothetical protein
MAPGRRNLHDTPTGSPTTAADGSPREINHQQLDEIVADFSALGQITYLNDPILGFGYAATERDDLGLPQFSPELPQVPVALVERHQALLTHPDNDTPQQEVWTEHALTQGMQRIGHGVHQLPNLDGWLIAERPRDGGGLGPVLLKLRRSAKCCVRAGHGVAPRAPGIGFTPS